FFERGVDVAAGDLLWHHAKARQYGASKGADAELKAFEVGDAFDFLTEPAAHLSARVTAGKIDNIVGSEEFAQQVETTALQHPGVHLAGVQAKGDGRVETEGGVFAVVVVRGRVATLYSAV